ncbi:polysaccharide biosynthesis/export family protein [Amorphus sp. 3PC139-8]|uniref:polysaccharide biosynthesis/export family protein n=1 Tax=Amorphus sp. 3PC139-8 TaxID=2735676 RepID=UPI00345CA26E
MSGIIVLLLAALLLPGCVSSDQQGSNSATSSNGSGAPLSFESAGGTSVSSPATSATSPAGSAKRVGSTSMTSIPAAATLADEDYRLAPQDILEVSVFQVPDLTKTVEINALGEIGLPLIGSVKAGGKTTQELEQDIAAKLSENYLQSPQVSVFVKEYRSQRVTVEGAVKSPGVYEIPGTSSLLQVLAMAKGVDRVADSDNVIIFRVEKGERLAALFDIDKIKDGTMPDPVIRGGDTIVVNDSGSKVAWRNFKETLGVVGFFRPFIF